VFFGAALSVSFPIFVVGSFLLGAGITMLQVVANPYLAALGSSETAGSRINLAGGFNSLATFIAPYFAIYVMFGGKDSTAVVVDDVKIPYIGLLIFALLLSFIFGSLKLPEIGSKSSDAGDKVKLQGNAWQFSHLTLGVLAIFAYVGAEVAVGSNLGLYLESTKMPAFYDLGFISLSKVSLYWGGLMVGRFLGSSVFKDVNSKLGLTVVSLGSMAFTLAGAFLPGELGVFFLIAVGLFHSVMWGYIFGLAIEGLGRYTNQASGYLLMGVFGGAVVPLVQALLADKIGNFQLTFAFVALCQAYLLFYALVGSKPNKVDAA
jgi:FHS family L-fucose permease-like MFS transporter